jgi:hypothetical protein
MKKLLFLFSIAALLPFFFLTVSVTSCDPNKKDSTKTTVVDPPRPDCEPVRITELYKLELFKADYDNLKAAFPANDAITLQFSYIPAATKRLTLVAYATKPGRDFQPPSLKHLSPIEVSPVVLPDTVSFGDQYVKFGGGTGLTQLINGSGHAADYYSLTFTPDIVQTSHIPLGGGPAIFVKNIKYKICVRVQDSPGHFIEICGGAAVDTQPSPPAN